MNSVYLAEKELSVEVQRVAAGLMAFALLFHSDKSAVAPHVLDSVLYGLEAGLFRQDQLGGYQCIDPLPLYRRLWERLAATGFPVVAPPGLKIFSLEPPARAVIYLLIRQGLQPAVSAPLLGLEEVEAAQILVEGMAVLSGEAGLQLEAEVF